MIRWRKRLNGWAGFIGTSRKATARILRRGRRIEVKIRFGLRDWLNAGTVRAAMAWAERQLHREPVCYGLPDEPAWFIHADGTTELRHVQPMQSHQFRRFVTIGDWTAPSIPVKTVVFTGQSWSQDVRDSWSGIHERFRVLVYVEDGADSELVKRTATESLQRQIAERLRHL